MEGRLSSLVLPLVLVVFHHENREDEYNHSSNYLVFQDNWNMFSGDGDIPWGIKYPLGSLKKKKNKGDCLACVV